MSPTAYSDVLAKNLRGARGRAGLQLEPLAARMRALGFSKWKRQTIASIEKGERRVTAEEIFGLSVALGTSIASLMAPADEDKIVEFPSGDAVSVEFVQRLTRGYPDGSVEWDGDKPVFHRVPPQVAELWRRANMTDELEAGISAYSRPRRPVVAAIVTSHLGVLVGRRNDRTPPWGFISGEIEPGEVPEDAAVREVKEETGLEVRAGQVIGERDHPATGRHMVYLAAEPVRGTEVFVGDEAELAEVRWVGLAEADELMPTMFEPVREHLARELGDG